MATAIVILGVGVVAMGVGVILLSRQAGNLRGRVEWLETKVRMVVRKPPGEPGKEG